MPAHPRVGDGYLQQQAPNVADRSTVLSLDEERTVPAGTFGSCCSPRTPRPGPAGRRRRPPRVRRGHRPGRGDHDGRRHGAYRPGLGLRLPDGSRWRGLRRRPRRSCSGRADGPGSGRRRRSRATAGLRGACWGACAAAAGATPAAAAAGGVLRLLPLLRRLRRPRGLAGLARLTRLRAAVLLVPLLLVGVRRAVAGHRTGRGRRPKRRPEPGTGSPWRPNTSG